MAKRTTSKPAAPATPAASNCAYDLKQIREIVGLMAENNLTYFHSEQKGAKLELRRGSDLDAVKELLKSMPVGSSAAPVSYAAPAPAPAAAPVAAAPVAAAPAASSGEPIGPTINSPMVGTFYRSSAPGEKAFVNIGDSVDENTNVCIIEAMKVMNEIKAEARGTIARVLVEDGKPVQYGQPLFELKA
ncbi:acetyl-CoA carboxylase biotin carboxyl carrier protein [Prosthecobacter sp.]|uniref:acetyl-CoA carboxylase biotin carboxyl carrier protein n=1 Tax=Prosthecobacter sp. TaxID=1965333 RepID=UPI001D5C3394|nr:acetyl-CoA carboxylase biotin carboxyl carrier protein [Prosthecobacter sp.]MCB1276866.1 acetyl-CoA carboxylase biotin carboxyl carrier protein [Prosthecobacter sp.]